MRTVERVVAALLVDDAVVADDGLYGHDHDLRLGILNEVAQAGELAAVVFETGRREAVAVGQLLLKGLEGGKCALFDGDGGTRMMNLVSR